MDNMKGAGSFPEVVGAWLSDLQNYRSVVTGYARLLQRERLGSVTAQQATALAAIERAMRQIGDLMDKMSSVLNLEPPRPVHRGIGSGHVELGTLISEVVAELSGDSSRTEQLPPVDVRILAALDEARGHRSLLKPALEGMVRFAFRFSLKAQRGLSIHVTDAPEPSKLWVAIAPTECIQEALRLPRESLTPRTDRDGGGYVWFDLAFATRIMRSYGGEILALPVEFETGVIVELTRLAEPE